MNKKIYLVMTAVGIALIFLFYFINSDSEKQFKGVLNTPKKPTQGIPHENTDKTNKKVVETMKTKSKQFGSIESEISPSFEGGIVQDNKPPIESDMPVEMRANVSGNEGNVAIESDEPVEISSNLRKFEEVAAIESDLPVDGSFEEFTDLASIESEQPVVDSNLIEF